MTKLKLPMVLAVVDYTAKGTPKLLSTFDAAVNQLAPLDADRLLFGHLDGKLWNKFASNHNATPPAVLLLNPEAHMHYALREELTIKGISSFLKRVLQGEVQMVSSRSINEGILDKIKRKLKEHYPWSLLCIVPLLLYCLWALAPYPDTDKEKAE